MILLGLPFLVVGYILAYWGVNNFKSWAQIKAGGGDPLASVNGTGLMNSVPMPVLFGLPTASGTFHNVPFPYTASTSTPAATTPTSTPTATTGGTAMAPSPGTAIPGTSSPTIFSPR